MKQKSKLSILSLVLSLSNSNNAQQLPQVDFDRMGSVGLAGSFVGFDFFSSNSSSNTFDSSTATLLSRSSSGALSKLGTTNQGGAINAGCELGGKFYFGGTFSSIGGVSTSNVALYDSSKGSFTALGGGKGLDGKVATIFCDSQRSTVWFGGSFSSPSSNVALYNPSNDAFSPPPFGGLNGDVSSISPSASSLFFTGQFHTSFASSANSTSTPSGSLPTVSNSLLPPSSGSTTFSRALVPIPLSADMVDPSPSTSQSGFSNIGNALCPSGPDGPGNTWLARDNTSPLITIRTFEFMTAAGFRLGNTAVQGRGTKTFTITNIPFGQAMELSYTDPTTGTTKTCTKDCPLPPASSAAPFVDYLLTPSASLTGAQVALTSWDGPGAGLHLLQILSNGGTGSAVSTQNGVSCFASGTGSGVTTSGTWKPQQVDTSIPATQLQVLIAQVKVGTSSAQGPSVTWTPYLSSSGVYTVNLLVPGCVQLQDCASRTDVKVTLSPGGGLPDHVATVSQAVQSDTAQEVYSGPIIPSSSAITVKMGLADSPTGQGSGGQWDLVADRVQLVLVNGDVNGGNSTSPGNPSPTPSQVPGGSQQQTQSGFGFFEWDLNNSGSVNATGTLTNSSETANDALGFAIPQSAVIKSSAVHSPSGTIFLGGTFSIASPPSQNILAWKNGGLAGLPSGGLNGAVVSMILSGDSNTLFVGGAFTDTATASSTSLKGVAAYDVPNNKWVALGGGVDGTVASLSLAGGQVVVAGNFTHVIASGSSSIAAAGLATWDIASSTWVQPGGFLVGQLTFTANGTSDGFVAGNVQSASQFGGDGFVELTNHGVVPLKVELQSGAAQPASGGANSTLLKRVASLFARQASPSSSSSPEVSINAGAFWTNSSKQVTILGGNFSFPGGQNVALYLPDSGSVTPLNGAQVQGTVFALLVVQDKLYIGGQFNANGAQGFAVYDLSKNAWDTSSSSTSVQGVVKSITSTPFKTDTVYIAGNFTVSGCTGICAFGINNGQWNALSGGSGQVTSVDYASSDSSLLIAGGALTLSGATSAVGVGIYSIANNTWTSLGDESKLLGTVTAVAVNGGNSSSIFAAGQSRDNSGPFLSFWNGVTWTVLSGSSSSLGNSASSIQQLLVVPLQSDRSSASDILQADRMLMISGSLGNASSTLFDGSSFIPYIVTRTQNGALGTVAAMFRSLASFSFSQKHFLATGVVILISIAISAGIVFLLALIGILWTLLLRRGEENKYYIHEDDDESMRSGHNPSSLLEHINAATRGTILGAGAVSPFESAAARKEAQNRSSRITPDPDPFAADTQDGHGHGQFVHSEDTNVIGTAISSGEGDDEPIRSTRVRYSFDGAGEGELSVSQGAQVDVLDSHDAAWWFVRDANGREGVVPASYLY